jgi:hypothetical protein
MKETYTERYKDKERRIQRRHIESEVLTDIIVI